MLFYVMSILLVIINKEQFGSPFLFFFPDLWNIEDEHSHMWVFSAWARDECMESHVSLNLVTFVMELHCHGVHFYTDI